MSNVIAVDYDGGRFYYAPDGDPDCPLSLEIEDAKVFDSQAEALKVKESLEGPEDTALFGYGKLTVCTALTETGHGQDTEK